MVQCSLMKCPRHGSRYSLDSASSLSSSNSNVAHNARGASEHHAVGGPLRVEDERSPRPLTGRFLAAAAAAGIPLIDDYNGPEQDGASIVQVTQRNGRRWMGSRQRRRAPSSTSICARAWRPGSS